jgi:ATP-dependent DNA helicase RecQ
MAGVMSGASTPLDPEELLRRLLAAPASHSMPEFDDDLYARVAHVCWDAASGDLDFAVLIRHLLRRWSIQDSWTARVETAPLLSARLRRAAAAVDLREHPSDTWTASPWQPDWLGSAGTPDAAAAAGTARGRRFREDDLAADPFFENYTRHQSYRTPGQRAASRAMVSIPAGSTLIAMLPTGTGKTEVALCLAQQRRYAVTLIVVPTTALAYDFERRFREHYARLRPGIDPTTLDFAWTANTGADLRERLRARLREGVQPLLITSPESVSRALRGQLMEAAGTGRLAGLVVDEAHLVTQWGRTFRPEFRTLANLRQDLLRRAAEAGHPLPTTLLLSATLGPHELRDLHELFGQPGPCSLVAANALRTEPEFWIAAAGNEEQRDQWVVEALTHLPRPAILYVTSPERADDWLARLTTAGFRRLAQVTGATRADDRSRVLDGLRTTSRGGGSIDLVVGTSAFGLGIDYAHVRTVVHACLPETVDRWYQELGRGGRDGDASAALLLTAPGDRAEAESLGAKVLTTDTARKRWSDLWSHRRVLGERTFLDLEGAQGTVARGSYNRRWNAQLVQGLVELAAVRRYQVDVEDLAELAGERGEQRDWTAVERLRADLSDATFWTERWTPWQRQETSRSRQALDAIGAVARRSKRACVAIALSYRADDDTHSIFGPAAKLVEPLVPCGRCPGCRAAGTVPPDDPPPRPMQEWPLSDDLAPRLDDLAGAAGARDGLVLLVAEDQEQVAHPLAQALVRRGVRHIAGPIEKPIKHRDWLFIDRWPVTPTELTPVSSFVVYPKSSPVPVTWLSLRRRLAARSRAPRPFDVLLLARDAVVGGRQVGRDLPALDATTALDILEG